MPRWCQDVRPRGRTEIHSYGHFPNVPFCLYCSATLHYALITQYTGFCVRTRYRVC